MVSLLALVAILQAAFFWILKPLINVSTPIFEFRGFGLVILLIAACLISGESKPE